VRDDEDGEVTAGIYTTQDSASANEYSGRTSASGGARFEITGVEFA